MTSPAQFPPAVLPGARVGVAALSGPVRPERLARGVEGLRELGFEPVLARNLLARDGLFAGADDERLAAFHELVADPTLAAIFFARGGHGLLRVLPDLDWELIARRPRAYVGYSDLTPFLLGVVARLGWVAFHGPLVAGELERGILPEESRSLLAALAGEPLPAIPVGGWATRGSVEGVLLGGCLSLLTATLATPWAADLDDAILFWEDVNEPLYRIDRMLTHLRLSGTLAAVRGMAVGTLGAGRCYLPDGAAEEDWMRVLRDSGVRGPVAWGLPCGHGAPNLTLPLGRPARLDATTEQLILL